MCGIGRGNRRHRHGTSVRRTGRAGRPAAHRAGFASVQPACWKMPSRPAPRRSSRRPGPCSRAGRRIQRRAVGSLPKARADAVAASGGNGRGSALPPAKRSPHDRPLPRIPRRTEPACRPPTHSGRRAGDHAQHGLDHHRSHGGCLVQEGGRNGSQGRAAVGNRNRQGGDAGRIAGRRRVRAKSWPTPAPWSRSVNNWEPSLP